MSEEKKSGLPTKAEILAFVKDSTHKVGKREIARAFHVSGTDRIHLKRLLRDMEDEGLLSRGRGRGLHRSGDLPPVAVISVTGVDGDGLLMAQPSEPPEDGMIPTIMVMPGKHADGLGAGDHALAHLDRMDLDAAEAEQHPAGFYQARVIRKLDRQTRDVLGLYNTHKGRGRIYPTNRKHKQEYDVERSDAMDAKPGELVLAQLLPGHRLGLRRAKVIEILADTSDPKAMSLMAIHGHGIPSIFPDKVVADAEAAEPAVMEQYREDLRPIPLVTIDGEDARDFDDAVFAEPDRDAKNPGGWVVWVAIADVSYYVQSGSPLDREAFKRGNSTYFPDRVIPMLPEALSNGLCSLMPQVDRACLAVRMVFNAAGKKTGHRFTRGLMRSAARLTYNQVQNAMDGMTDETTANLLDGVIKPLYGAYDALMSARTERGTLDLDLPERQVVLDDNGHVIDIATRERKDSHKLIEEFMIAANVAAAEELERMRQPCMYRVHEDPPEDKIQNLADFLETLSIPFAKGQVVRPKTFNRLLESVRGEPHQQMVNDVVLRTQTQAYYGPDNAGHFGLALQKYAHFTSPIRRYADLLVHRGLVRGLKLGPGGLQDWEADQYDKLGEAISQTERRSMQAEREAIDRFTVSFMADHVGKTYNGRVASVTGFGMFIRLAETGADGLIPMASLPGDYYIHDEELHMLVGIATGLCFRLGDTVKVKLSKADTVTGSLQFELLEGGQTLSRKELQKLGYGDRRRSTKGKRSSRRKSNPKKGAGPKRPARPSAKKR